MCKFNLLLLHSLTQLISQVVSASLPLLCTPSISLLQLCINLRDLDSCWTELVKVWTIEIFIPISHRIQYSRKDPLKSWLTVIPRGKVVSVFHTYFCQMCCFEMSLRSNCSPVWSHLTSGRQKDFPNYYKPVLSLSLIFQVILGHLDLWIKTPGLY